MAAGALAFPAVAVAARSTCLADAELVTRPGVPVTSAARKTARGVEAGGPAAVAGLAGLLARRDRVVVEAAALASAGSAGSSTDPVEAGALAGSALVVTRRVGRVPLTGWSSRVTDVLGVRRTTAAGSAADLVQVDARVEVRYRIRGDQTDTVRNRRVVAERRAGCWSLTSDRPDAGIGAVPDLWDLGEIRVERSERVVAVASTALDATLVRDTVADAEAAARAVDRVWGTGWRRQPVLLLPADLAGAAAVSGGDVTALAQLAAVMYGPSALHGQDGSAFGDIRVLFAPDALRELTADGRRFVLAHELTHVATLPTAPLRPPLWLSECFADMVGYAALGLPEQVVADLVRDGLADLGLTGLPPSLPDVAAFDPALRDVRAAYALSAAACLALGDGFRPDRLATAYRIAAGLRSHGAGSPAGAGGAAGAGSTGAAAGRPFAALTPSAALPGLVDPVPPDAASGDPNAADAVAVRAAYAALGTDETALVAAWHRRVLDLVGPIPGSR